MKKWVFILVLTLLAQPAWTAPKRLCHWAKTLSRSCDKVGPFPLAAEQIQKVYAPLGKTAILEELNSYEPETKTDSLYSYKLAAPVERVQMQKDRRTLTLYFTGDSLLGVAKDLSANRRIQTEYDIPLTAVAELAAKERHGQRIAQHDVQKALGAPKQTSYFFSPLYEGPVYQLLYGPEYVFITDGVVLKIARGEAEKDAYLQLIKAYDPTAQEIVITQEDIRHTPTFPIISIWDKNAPELYKIFRNKTREYALYSIENVSDKDIIIRSKNRTEYALVEYKSGGEYRKFLFKAESPQTFVNVAATMADVLAINKKYGVFLTVNRREFTQNYGNRLEKTETTRVKDNALVEVYATKDGYFVFENGEMKEFFETDKPALAYMEKIELENQKLELKQQSEQQQALIQQQQAELKRRLPHRNVTYIYSDTSNDWDNRGWVIKSPLPKFETPKLDPNAELNPNPASF